MNTLPNQLDFDINSSGQISREFVERNLLTFQQAALFVKELDYGRNADKVNLVSVFAENRGTCSTKHALLKRLADENGFDKVRLVVGLFRMNKNNTPKVAAALQKNSLEYIPEAHCYLRYEDQILDLTTKKSKPSDFLEDLIEETEITPEWINEYKVSYHKNYLVNWLEQNKQIKFSLNDLWKIREQCIQDLSKINEDELPGKS
jgi:hypothetical protein